jgi:hypothetical protein
MPAAAQNVYKCGDGYSQQPCPGGRSLAIDDGRSEAQKKQTNTAARRDARMADAMEKERLRQEAQPVPSYVPPPQFAPVPDTKPKAAPGAGKLDTFTAVVPGTGKPPKDAADKKKPKKPEKPAAR